MDDRSGQARFDALMAKVDELGQVCARLSHENAELRDQVSRLSAGPPAAGPRPARPRPVRPAPATSADTGGGGGGAEISRRKMGRAIGAVAASAIGAGALIETAQPAAAADGGAVIAGNVNKAEHRTTVTYDGASGFPGVVLLGNDSTYDGNGANFPAGLGGFAGAGSTAGAGGVKNGIYGYTDNGGGNGVVGYNSNFVAGAGAGVLGLAFGANATAVQGTNTLGTGVAGNSGSTASSATAVIGTITSTSPGGFSAGVRGVNSGTGGLGIGVWGSHAGAGWGVYATSVKGVGVVASGGTGTGVSAAGAVGVSASGTTGVAANGGTTGLTATGPTGISATGSGSAGIAVAATSASSGTTIKATNTGTGAAVHAINAGPGGCIQAESTNGRGGTFSGGPAQIQLIAGTGATHPKSGKVGDLYVDKTARLWFCKKAGATATWVQVV